MPGIGAHKADCVVARVHAVFAGPQAPADPGRLIVHRLDMDTSGLMVVALDADAQRDLAGQFERRIPEKAYIALVDGLPEREEGEISLPLRLDVERRPFQIVDPVHGRPATTRFRVLAREIDRSRLHLVPHTGRTHQLRVHCARGLNCPILGDVLYGKAAAATFAHGGSMTEAEQAARTESPRLMLHASRLSFLEPGTQTRVEFESPAPF